MIVFLLSSTPIGHLLRLAPGLLLSALVALTAAMIEWVEVRLFAHAWLEALVLALLIGALVRTFWLPPARFWAGIHHAGHGLLEIAIALIGATMSFALLAKTGVTLILAIALLVAGMIPISYSIGRLFGLSGKMALLVACGNAICGNSAIAAVAPAIDADGDDVASSIAFTAILGIALVLLLPVGARMLALGPMAGGALVGMTVYAVPQVVAAAAPLGMAAVQFGTVVKLVRILMLGPVVVVLSLIHKRIEQPAARGATRLARTRSYPLPWFILAFLGLAGLRSAGFLSDDMARAAGEMATVLTILAMAALGLGVDLRAIRSAGLGISATVISSLVILVVGAFAIVRILNI